MDARDLQAEVDGLMDGLRADLERLAAIPSDRLPRLPGRAGAGGARPRSSSCSGTPVSSAIEPDRPARHRPRHLRRDPAADPGRADRPALLALRRAAAPATRSCGSRRPSSRPPVEGGLRARGIADDKSNVIAHLGHAAGASSGRPPVGVKIVFEGQEEYGSPFDDYPPTDPERFACDAMVIADLGNLRPGTPTLTTGLRGASEVIVEVRTLEEPRHSGEFGGAAPDALLVLLKALATLHDVHGDVAVAGLRATSLDGRRRYTRTSSAAWPASGRRCR